MNCVLIKMGGKGVRFGSKLPKQFYEIDGEPLFAYVLKRYAQIKCIDKFIIVTNRDWMELTHKYADVILDDKLLEIVPGSDTNVRSTREGVLCASKYLKEDDIILVHDVTDPIINPKTIRNAVEAGEKYGCAAVAIEQVHTLYTKEGDFITGIMDKSKVGSGYSPEAFSYKIIFDCFNNATEDELNNMTSAISLAQAHGYRPFLVFSHQVNTKITYHEDMEALKYLIKNGENLYTE